MQFSYFEKEIDRLRGVYSPGSLNEERKKVLWDRFKSVPDHVFTNAINHLIGEFTTMALPAMSRFAEAVGMFRTNPNGASMQILPPPFTCEACRDFGFGFVGDTVVKCACPQGDQISPQELVRQQGNYDRGRKLLPNRQSLSTYLKGGA